MLSCSAKKKSSSKDKSTMFAQFVKKEDDIDPTNIDALGDAIVSAFDVVAVVLRMLRYALQGVS